MPNQHIRESKQALDSLKTLFRNILKPITVYRCFVCSLTLEDQWEIISHMMEKHTLKEIWAILEFDGDFRTHVE